VAIRADGAYERDGRVAAFSVAGQGASEALVQQAKPVNALNPAGRVIPRWVAFAAIMVFIGTLALRVFVTAPAIGHMGSEEGRLLAVTDHDRVLVFAARHAVHQRARDITRRRRYRATGLYTPMAGAWDARVTTRHGSFPPVNLTVTAKQLEAEKAPTPAVAGSTVAWGLGELLAVVLALGGARAISQRMTRRRGALVAAESTR
jgi:hypothetical protein